MGLILRTQQLSEAGVVIGEAIMVSQVRTIGMTPPVTGGDPCPNKKFKTRLDFTAAESAIQERLCRERVTAAATWHHPSSHK
jgi:hypothetical protein